MKETVQIDGAELHETTVEATPHISLRAEPLFHIDNFPVTNSLFMTFFVTVVLIGASSLFKKQLKLIPGKFQNAIEFVIEEVLKLMDSVLGGREKSEKYLPLVGTIFIFILAANWSGLLPGVGTLGIRDGHTLLPFLRPPAADLNFTLAIALTTVITVNLLAILALGFRVHASKFFNFKNPAAFGLGILELISEFAKIISFSFRLFGNVFAGEVLLAITAFLVPYVVPLPFMFLEIFVGFIQALVFAMLALVFLAVATAEHEVEAH